MNKVATYLITSFVFSMNTGLVFSQMNTPTAAKKEKTLLHHNHQRIDNYYWMNERDSPQVLEYISKENEYARDYFGPLKNLQEKLLEEFESRIDPNESFAPVSINGLTYQIRNKVGEDYGYIYLLNGDKEMIYFNENERAKGNSFYSLGDWNPSPDNNTLAVGEDFTGRRKYQIQFRNNKTGKYLKDKIIDTDGSLVWGNDNKTVFYVRKDPQTLREFQIWRHVLGTSPEKDELVYEEKDEKFYVFVSKSMTKKHILIGSFSSLTSEVQLIDADKPLSSPQVFLKREPGHIYAVDFNDAGFIITSNKKAKNKKILFSKNIPTSIEACTEIQRHDKDVLIENVLVFKNHIVIEERQNGLKKIKVLNFKTMEFEYIAINEETYSIDFAFNDDYEGEKLYYSYNSMTTPSTIFKYDLTFKNQVVYHEKKLIDVNFNPKNYQSERIWAVANDGTKIPVSIVYRKGTVLEKAPVLLYGYGSYGYTIPDVFSATRLSLLDRGFIFASAHIRGSKYMGEEWYENGKFLKKKNTFTDFINVAEYLAHHKKCDPTKIYAQGGSAGGLLMGAIVNMAPHLWKGIVSQVPFVDVVTTMLDESIPLTVGEYEEWGNPNEKEYYEYMLSYSPYDNIQKAHYPAILVTTGYHDSQVQYWEPLKYIAKLREYKLDNKPLIFDCNMDAGHGGGSGRSNSRKEVAQVFSFLLNMEGLEN